MQTEKNGGEATEACPQGTAYEAPVCRVLADSAADPEVDVNVGICPYFKRDRGKGRINCEGASFRFPDKLARREYLYRFCAHPSGYKICPLKVALDHHYERKYDYHA